MLGEIEGVSDQTEGALSIVYPNIQVLAIPYLFDYVDQALEVFRGEFGDKLYEDCRQKTGMRTIAVWDNGGFRCFTNSVRPIRTPEDMNGLMMRTMEIPAHMEMVSALGANPVPVPWGELYSALAQGTVDAAENNTPSFTSNKHYEVCKHFSFDGHSRPPDILMVSSKIWDDLHPTVQEWILQAAQESSVHQRKLWTQSVQDSIEHAKAQGVTFYEVDQGLFAEKVQPMYDAITDETIKSLVNRIREYKP